jgi:hypothetical protein
MIRFVAISWVCGILYWILDGVINGNPFARKLYQVYKSEMKVTLNIPKSFFIYLLYGFAMASIFLLLYKSLPGKIGLVKGISFAMIAWFFRGFMGVMSQWMMYDIPSKTLIYVAFSGLCEALILGMFLGLTLKTFSLN